MSNNTRKATTALIERVENGELTWEQIARAALNHFSEDEISDMASYEELLDIEDEEDEDEDEEDRDDWDEDMQSGWERDHFD